MAIHSFPSFPQTCCLSGDAHVSNPLLLSSSYGAPRRLNLFIRNRRNPQLFQQFLFFCTSCLYCTCCSCLLVCKEGAQKVNKIVTVYRITGENECSIYTERLKIFKKYQIVPGLSCCSRMGKVARYCAQAYAWCTWDLPALQAPFPVFSNHMLEELFWENDGFPKEIVDTTLCGQTNVVVLEYQNWMELHCLKWKNMSYRPIQCLYVSADPGPHFSSKKK
ncbi:hypothetical protein XELAEV_18014607mg [Xenopus laevis]|uniref:Uncharacterized protein n=1 Tax=Xenopus laevis TaxID=8355 RepID=A0A974HV60_XENLA|nr:hypothetical protein XELAEV_18014607mg [Xenopus laevis]